LTYSTVYYVATIGGEEWGVVTWVPTPGEVKQLQIVVGAIRINPALHSADISFDVSVLNNLEKPIKVAVEYWLIDSKGQEISRQVLLSDPVTGDEILIEPGGSRTITITTKVKQHGTYIFNAQIRDLDTGIVSGATTQTFEVTFEPYLLYMIIMVVPISFITTLMLLLIAKPKRRHIIGFR